MSIKKVSEFPKLYNGDCLEVMQNIPDGSIDMILCDLPYGDTKNKWDTVILFEPLWKEYFRIIKDNGAIVLFAQGMFTAKLMMSNPKFWRYNLVWDKVLPSGFLNSNRMPLRSHEDICVFYKKPPVYNPQKFTGNKNHSKGVKKNNANNNYGDFDFVDNSDILGDKKFPVSILRFPKPHPSVCSHPTQKPVELLEWLIKTYTNEGEIVLDNCMGSGSTGIACKHTDRKFIGIELYKEYFDIAKERIKNE